jgi:hypothetical protein
MKHLLLSAALVFVVNFVTPNEAAAAPNGRTVCHWEVQLKYVLWDTEGTVFQWLTVYSSSNQASAQFVHDILVYVRDTGGTPALTSLFPHGSWLWMPEDVRLIEECVTLRPWFFEDTISRPSRFRPLDRP